MRDATKQRDMTAIASLSFEAAFRASLDDAGGALVRNEAGAENLCVAQIETPLDTIVAIADDHALHMLEFFDRSIFGREVEVITQATGKSVAVAENPVIRTIRNELGAFFAGAKGTFETPLALHGTDFVQSVWRALLRVPPGETRSYGALSHDLNNPRAVRAVAQANGANRLAIVVPCHRIIGADGSLTGYGGGLWRKRWLLDHEIRHFGHRLL